MLLYHIGLWFYFAGIRLAALFHTKARKMVVGQRAILRDLPSSIQDQEVTWFHASSLGEFEQGKPVIEAWRKRNPNSFILLTFFSPSGYEIQQNNPLVDHVCYLPFDSSSLLITFLKRIRPKRVIFIKYDIWPRLIKKLLASDIELFLVSGAFRKGQFYFRWWGRPFLRLLEQFDHLFVQNNSSKALLVERGLTATTVTGDTRVDRVVTLAEKNTDVPGLTKFVQSSFVLIAGSSWAPEEKLVAQLDREHFPGMKIILAPHDVSEKHLLEIEKLFSGRTLRYEDLICGEYSKQTMDVLLIDRVGLLTKLYKYADLALIGGGYVSGLHNTLEPAAFGLPVLFGPEYGKFQEASDLCDFGGGFAVKDFKEFNQLALLFFNDKNQLFNAGAASRRYVDNHKGATVLVINRLMENG